MRSILVLVEMLAKIYQLTGPLKGQACFTYLANGDFNLKALPL
jgi:hypothetical protein